MPHFEVQEEENQKKGDEDRKPFPKKALDVLVVVAVLGIAAYYAWTQREKFVAFYSRLITKKSEPFDESSKYFQENNRGYGT